MRAMRMVYLILSCFAAPVAALIAYLRGLRDPARRERLADRFGRPAVRAAGPTIWVHAASMGEAQAAAALVRQLLERYPHDRIVMTTMTATGAARVKALFAERVTHCFLPYDLPFAARGFFDRIRPRLALIVETELWPCLLRECTRRNIPLVVASARISPRTAARYSWLRSLLQPSLARATIAAQTDADAQRFEALGAAAVQVVGNIKFDLDIPAAVYSAGARWRAALGERFVWVAGSTHAGEETAALAAHRRLLERRPDALMILVPRHPQRFDEVRALLAKEALPFVARSSNAVPAAGDAILFIDALGELLDFYAAADIAFVGGSLANIGGHNLLEPAALGAPILTGPHVFNAQDIAERLAQAGALRYVRSADELGATLIELAGDAAQRATLGQRGKQVVALNRGAVDRVMKLLADRCAP